MKGTDRRLDRLEVQGPWEGIVPLWLIHGGVGDHLDSAFEGQLEGGNRCGMGKTLKLVSMGFTDQGGDSFS